MSIFESVCSVCRQLKLDTIIDWSVIYIHDLHDKRMFVARVPTYAGSVW
jgi:hypothetical protein